MPRKIVLALLILLILVFSARVSFAQTLSPDQQKSEEEFRETIHDLFSIFRIYSFPTPIPGSTSSSPTPTPAPGQSGTSAPSPTTVQRPPSPPQSSGNAISLYHLIDVNCGGVATIANNCYNKVKDVDILVQNNAREEMRISIYDTGTSQFQCVGLAKTVSRMNGATWNVSHGSAANYARSTPPSGFRFVRKGVENIKVGDYPIWDRDGSRAPDGHMAVVSVVFPDGNTYEVVEANVSGRGEVTISSTRRVNSSDYWSSKLLGWYTRI